MKFYCAWYCPFAQRVWMALLLKEIDFEYIEVDPYRESKWWLSISRNSAMVPVIIESATGQTDEFTVIDSSRILEYLDEQYSKTYPLFMELPAQRAEQRFWMDHINGQIVPNLYRLLQSDRPEKRDRAKRKLLDGMHSLLAAASTDSCYFHGEKPGLIDLLLIPFAYRIEVLLSHYRNFTVPNDSDEWNWYQQWYGLMQQQKIFQATATDQDNYRQRLLEAYAPKSPNK